MTTPPRMVQCAKLGRELPGLRRPPFPGDFGMRIYSSVSQEAWNEWLQQQMLLINHYGLNMTDPQAQALLRQQMEQFLFGGGDAPPEGWSAEP